MKSIGEVLKEKRVRRKYSRQKLERLTKIKKSFIEAIEKEEWQKLPELPVVTGFVKNIAQSLNIDRNNAVALLRRDYPPKKVAISPKPDVAQKFIWSPKLTFFVGLFVCLVVIMSYLVFQYVNFTNPPKLEVLSPKEGQEIVTENLAVVGMTDPEATIVVNNQPVLVDGNGSFKAEIEIFEGTEEVVIVARSRSGKETVIRRKIIPKLGEP
jgi:transcriptional regulator with XRE-family HTH domain